MRVLYVSPMEYGANPAVDAVGQGLQSRLAEHGIELRVICADFRSKDWPGTADAAMLAGVRTAVDAIVVWVVTPDSAATGAAAETPHFASRSLTRAEISRTDWLESQSMTWSLVMSLMVIFGCRLAARIGGRV